MCKQKTCYDEQQIRANKYDCEGICYASTFMCPRVETCPETRSKEFKSTILAVIIIVTLMVSVCIGMIYLLLNL